MGISQCPGKGYMLGRIPPPHGYPRQAPASTPLHPSLLYILGTNLRCLFPALVVKPNRVHQLFSRTYSRTRVLAYSRTSFTQTPVDAWRKITFAAPAKNASNGIFPNFRVTRAVLISDRCAINRRIVCAVFAHGGQT